MRCIIFSIKNSHYVQGLCLNTSLFFGATSQYVFNTLLALLALLSENVLYASQKWAIIMNKTKPVIVSLYQHKFNNFVVVNLYWIFALSNYIHKHHVLVLVNVFVQNQQSEDNFQVFYSNPPTDKKVQFSENKKKIICLSNFVFSWFEVIVVELLGIISQTNVWWMY